MKKILCVLITVLCLALCLSACSEPAEPQTDSETTTTTVATTTTVPTTVSNFLVTVVDQNGNPVPDTWVQICKDSCIPAKTDANGVAAFSIEIEDGHKLSVMTPPAGYTYTGGEVYLESGATSYTLELQGEA